MSTQFNWNESNKVDMRYGVMTGFPYALRKNTSQERNSKLVNTGSKLALRFEQWRSDTIYKNNILELCFVWYVQRISQIKQKRLLTFPLHQSMLVLYQLSLPLLILSLFANLVDSCVVIPFWPPSCCSVPTIQFHEQLSRHFLFITLLREGTAKRFQKGNCYIPLLKHFMILNA